MIQTSYKYIGGKHFSLLYTWKICMYWSPVHLQCNLYNITRWLTYHLTKLNLYASPILHGEPNCLQYMKVSVSPCSLDDASLAYTHLVSQMKSDHMLFAYRPVNNLLTATNSHHTLRFNGTATFKIAMQYEFCLQHSQWSAYKCQGRWYNSSSFLGTYCAGDAIKNKMQEVQSAIRRGTELCSL
jgi:hypothetical protein